MICPQCKAQIDDQVKFCPYCGSPVTVQQQSVNQQNYTQQSAPGNQQYYNQQSYTANPQYANPQQYANNPQYTNNQQYTNANPQQYTNNDPYMNNQQVYTPVPEPARPMKWFKFVIYVQLFLAALANIGNAILHLTGTIYGDNASLVYDIFSGLKIIDIVIGLLYIVLAVLCIIARQRLAKFRPDGPMTYMVVLAANLLLLLIYNVLSSIIIGSITFDTSFGSTFVVTIVMIILNKIYFDKRKDLFTTVS